MPELRDYQKELLEKIEKYLALKRRLFSYSSENHSARFVSASYTIPSI